MAERECAPPMSGLTLLLIVSFFLIAVAYSLVGMGGGSAYLALLVLLDLGRPEIVKVVLTCNLIVACMAVIQFQQAGHFTLRIAVPLLASALPTSFLITFFSIPTRMFLIAVAILLLLAGCRMLIALRIEGVPAYKIPSRDLWAYGLPLGFILGAFIGAIGIGGGIFLVPMLAILHWGTTKQVGATTSLFIMLTSLVALIGKFANEPHLYELYDYIWVYPAVIAGGLIGSRIGARALPIAAFRLISAVLVLSVSAILFYRLFSDFIQV